MKVQLEKTYPMPASADTAWGLLQNVEGVASCMPGAAITERIDATHYKGTVSIKLGPASMAFRGDIEVASIDGVAKTVHLIGKGTDNTGSTAASMDLTARIDAIDAASCNLVGNSEVSMSGKAATFGGRMMVPVAEQVLKQFAANFASKVQALQAQAPASAPATPASSDPSPAQVAAAMPPSIAPGSTTQLNGFAFAWSILKDWLRSLFGTKRA